MITCLTSERLRTDLSGKRENGKRFQNFWRTTYFWRKNARKKAENNRRVED